MDLIVTDVKLQYGLMLWEQRYRIIEEVKKNGKHAQGAMAYTVSPVHTLKSWLDLAKQIEDAGADSVATDSYTHLTLPTIYSV